VTMCNLKTGLVGLTALALGMLAAVSSQAGTPLPLPLKPFVIAAKPAATPIAIQARHLPATLATTPASTAVGKLALGKVAPPVKPAIVALPSATTSGTATRPAAPAPYSQSTINQANAVGTTPQNIVSLAQGHPGPGAPTTFVETKQTILPPGAHSSPPSGAHCSHGVRVTYLNGGNTGGTNGLAAGTQAWAYSCA
jgi:hypothetical protein